VKTFWGRSRAPSAVPCSGAASAALTPSLPFACIASFAADLFSAGERYPRDPCDASLPINASCLALQTHEWDDGDLHFPAIPVSEHQHLSNSLPYPWTTSNAPAKILSRAHSGNYSLFDRPPCLEIQNIPKTLIS
jgi:hypothetical protein